jgi:hypothetical protein
MVVLADDSSCTSSDASTDGEVGVDADASD